jgi:hypothetical protein
MQPDRLRFLVSTRQTLSRTLHGEAEFVEQPRNVVVVVPNAKALRDEVADHRSSPHAA